MRRILVSGGREYGCIPSGQVDPAELLEATIKAEQEVKLLYATLDAKLLEYGDLIIIHGAARGADSLANQWAIENFVSVISCPADWDTYKNSAGYYRNLSMLEDHEPDEILAFAGGVGTAMMVKLGESVKMPVYKYSV